MEFLLFFNMDDNFNFNLRKAAIYRSLRWAKNPVFIFAKILKKIFFILFVICLPVFLYVFLTDSFNRQIQSLLLGLSSIFLSLFLYFWLIDLFFNSKVKKPVLKAKIKDVLSDPGKFNVADFLSFDSALIMEKSLDLLKKTRSEKMNSTLVFYSLILNSKKLNFVFFRALLDVGQIRSILKKHFNTFNPKDISLKSFHNLIREALVRAEKNGHSRIEMGDLIVGASRHDPVFKKVLIENNLKAEDIEALVSWLEHLKKEEKERREFWQWKNLTKKGSLGKEWAAGYSLNLDRFSTDLSRMVERLGFPQNIGHEKEIEAMERILSRQEINNVLIVGEPGKGRKNMVYELANRSVLGSSLPGVNYKRIVQLELSSLLAQTQSTEEVEVILDNVFKETMGAGNIILVINDFHNFIATEFKPGAIDISGIIAPYLNYPSFQIIAITTYEGLHKNIEQNSSILALFEKVEVSEISEEETLILLEKLSLRLERKYKRLISYHALRDIIHYCNKYLTSKPFPEKAMDLLDEAMVYLSQTKDKVLLPQHISRLVSEKIEIPVGEVEEKEKEILLDLENLMHERIINQEDAVREVSTALRRARSEITSKSGPIGTFLFLGPSGVGKTETSKALAEIYFGSEKKIIRLDMSEFQSVSDIPRLIGGPGEEGLLSTEVRENPFSLILLDEIEKAHPNILNLFLQVLDEGHLTDGMGRKVDFKNSIIIATSNAGYQIILKALKEKTEWFKVKEIILDYLFEEGLFRPEFINRFDAMVIFKPLSRRNLLDISDLIFDNLNKNLKEKEIELVASERLKQKIVELSYEPAFGARQMKRVVQEKVENVLAEAILSGRIKRGDRVEIDPEKFEAKVI